MKNDDTTLRYDKMVESALRGVVRQAISEVQEKGLPGDHHFYITFMTDFPGVQIPDYLRERYPGEMTIVLQYQFENLTVDETNIGVTLSFNNIPERLIVPISAVTIFADPSVNFALQFQPLGEFSDHEEEALAALALDEDGDDEPPKGGKKSKKTEGSGEVISLDKFRKK
ncbi:MAG TPA: ClpXP protease specificity-enhancing factor SspB [Alphaproteobacteria bacterium]|nr:ClpXP protease specificity-enhancing factor SspB [Alphaproteobacteria bacterium]HNS44495.1 ClpXP protease specificity-enhancing factor SspB [Alphaproteobacteria bacterium]